MSAHPPAVHGRILFCSSEIEAVLIRICLVGGTSDNTWLGQSGNTTKGSNNAPRETESSLNGYKCKWLRRCFWQTVGKGGLAVLLLGSPHQSTHCNETHQKLQKS